MAHSKCNLREYKKKADSLPSKLSHRSHCCHTILLPSRFHATLSPASVTPISASPVPQNVHSC